MSTKGRDDRFPILNSNESVHLETALIVIKWYSSVGYGTTLDSIRRRGGFTLEEIEKGLLGTIVDLQTELNTGRMIGDIPLKKAVLLQDMDLEIAVFVHVAGQPRDGVQLCTECECILDENGNVQNDEEWIYWNTGSFIVVSASGSYLTHKPFGPGERSCVRTH